MTAGWTTGRALAAGLAAAALGTLALRIGLNMENRGQDLGQAIWGVLRFFTIWTNALIGLAMLWVALGRRLGASPVSCLAMSIGMVSAVYYAALYHLTRFTGIDVVIDAMMHAVIPLGLIAYWLAFVDKSALRYRDALVWQLYPIAYCAFALIRGEVEGRYPYPFIRPPQIGWPAVILNIAVLAAVFVLAGLAVVALGRWMARRGGRAAV
ncbi:MAG: Pr6Pr family membrane protein [Pseudomonadota bacterium]